MNRTSLRTGVGRTANELRRRIGGEIRRLRLDAGISQARLAAAAQIDHGHLSRIEAGSREPSIAVLIAIGEVLGADVQLRLFPTTGPRIHDHIQAPMIDGLFVELHERWKRLAEVAVRRPARGFIDAVLYAANEHVVVATEAQSDIRRLEQQLRWAQDKADSLPSSTVWPTLAPGDAPPPRISQLLLLRSTQATRELARTFEATLASAYPARSADVHRALTTATGPWPGAGILWVVVEGGPARLLDRPPRGVRLGR